MSGGWKLCEPNRWTPVYQGPSAGFVYVSSTMPVQLKWRVVTGSPPFHWQANALVSGKTMIPFGATTVYVSFEVMPQVSAMLFGS
jgi:hypothetical protein